MKNLFSVASLSVALLSVMTWVHAGDRNEHAERHEARAEQRSEQRTEQRGEQQAQEHARNQERKVEERQAAGTESQPEAFKKPQRMTPEERRALRRQINEAGQDIYSRRQ